jgi:putative endopeptidase
MLDNFPKYNFAAPYTAARKYLTLSAFACLGLSLFACDSKGNQTTEKTDITQAAEAQNQAPADYKAIDLANFDTNVRPQDDFFQFVNGTWLTKTEIPDSEARWGSFNELRDKNKSLLKSVVEEALSAKGAAGSPEQLVADFYKSGMDTTAINQKGIAPLQAQMAAIEAATTVEELLVVAAEQRKVGVPSFFSLWVGADEKNSTQNILSLYQGGMSLPTKNYYLQKSFEAQLAAFEKYVATMLEKAGTPNAAAVAKNIVALEKKLAQVAKEPKELRDPEANYNKMAFADFVKKYPNLKAERYFNTLGANGLADIVVGQPAFFAGLDNLLKTAKLDDLKHYQKWCLLNTSAPYLSSNFADEHFNFFQKTLSGKKSQQERWKTVIETVDGKIGHALGQLYVAKAFSPKAKEKAIAMIENIRTAFGESIDGLTWMSEATKAKAKEKLNAIVYKIGYPDKWKNYEGLVIKADDYIGNIQRAHRLEFDEDMQKIGKPVDRTEWHMTPATVNAYYNPVQNEIVFPAAILQPPFFSEFADDAVNYGGIGAVIGHELSHGFDDQGSQYDADGNLKNWWTEQDRNAFKALTKKLVKQYDEYTVLDGLNVKGELTLGENIADLGGVTMAYAGLKRALAAGGSQEEIDGYTPEQRFFISWAQIWRTKHRDAELRRLIEIDPHSPGQFRANGPLSNFEPFFEAFEVKQGDKMRRDDLIKIW